jgi:hypothetical protein
MRTFLMVAAATALMAVSIPAFAQKAGTPGAAGVVGSMIGSNPGTGFGPNIYGHGHSGSYGAGANYWDSGPGYRVQPAPENYWPGAQ